MGFLRGTGQGLGWFWPGMKISRLFSSHTYSMMRASGPPRRQDGQLVAAGQRRRIPCPTIFRGRAPVLGSRLPPVGVGRQIRGSLRAAASRWQSAIDLPIHRADVDVSSAQRTQPDGDLARIDILARESGPALVGSLARGACACGDRNFKPPAEAQPIHITSLMCARACQLYPSPASQVGRMPHRTTDPSPARQGQAPSHVLAVPIRLDCSCSTRTQWQLGLILLRRRLGNCYPLRNRDTVGRIDTTPDRSIGLLA